MSLAGLKVDPAVLEKLSPEERERAAEELRLVERAVKDNPLLVYRPHGKQEEFHSPPFPALRAFFGGNRSGKTTATMVDTILQAVDWDVVPDHLRAFKRWSPPFYCRVVTPDLTRTLDGVVLQKFREWCPPAQLFGGAMGRAWDKQQVMLRFRNGSWIQFMSNDQDLDKFGGAALHRVVFDEKPRQDIRAECLTRLIDYDGEELYGMTPLNGMSWTFDELYEPWERLTSDGLEDAEAEEKLGCRVTVVDMDDNPHLSQKGKERALAAYTGEEREARKSGRFVSFAGLIYPQFSGTHVIPDIEEIPDGVEVFEGLDPGMRIMAAVVFCYLDHEDRLVVFDELALQGKTVAVVADQIRRKRAQWDYKPRWTIIDPAARNKSAQTGRSDQQEYLDHGITTIPGQNDVRPGINRVRERLEGHGPDEPRLVICSRCHELRTEFKKYRWAKDSKRTEGDPKDKPVKRDDHLLDALRYVVMQRPMAPRRDLLPETVTMRDRLLRADLKRLRAGRGRPLPDSGFGPGIFQ